MRVVFMGTPEFAVPSLEHLIHNQYQVVAVYTQPDRAAGRGRSLFSSPVKRVAVDCGLPVVQPAHFREAAAVTQLANFHSEAIVVAAYGQILPQEVLDIPAYGCINIHPSLLPEFRGASPIASAILAGKEFTGVSIMLMGSGVDTGPVLARAQVRISTRETTGSLTGKLSLVAAHLLMEVLAGWFRGELVPQPQDEARATYCGVITKEQGEIEWQLPAVEIWRRVRAFSPWPGCYTRWEGRQLKLIEAELLPGEKTLAPGQVVALNNKREMAFGVGTGAGVLGVLRLQLEGKRETLSADFLRGQRQFIGATLPSE